MDWNMNNSKCLRCGGCVSVCPTAAIEIREEVMYEKSLCVFCGNCEKACPFEAIEVTES